MFVLQALTRSLTSTSSESDNEFLETCRPTSLQAELEDDDEFPEPDDEDDENEDENEDDFEDVLAVVGFIESQMPAYFMFVSAL